MRIIIAGGSGLLGQALTDRLIGHGHDVVVLSRRAGRGRPNYREVSWTPDGSVGAWQSEIDRADAIVNLAGAGMADKRWTAERKAELRASRINSTRSLVTAVEAATRRPTVFIQGSGAGYYGAQLTDREFDETSPPGQDFLADLAVEWENAAAPVVALGCRLAVVRTGVVLARQGGALPPMARPFRFFVGGRVASGRQYLSWITRDDWVSLVTWAIATPGINGALNATTPTPVPNAEFSAALGRALGRPNWLPVPAFALRMLFGEMADALLIRGQRVIPTRTTSFGFRFEHTTLDHALAHVLRG